MNATQGNYLSGLERKWDQGDVMTDAELKTLLAGFEFLSGYHLHHAPVLVGVYRRRVEDLRRIIDARKG